jgi:hypothetical protein
MTLINKKKKKLNKFALRCVTIKKKTNVTKLHYCDATQ